MKNLLNSTPRIFSLTLTMLTLASCTLFAGGNDNTFAKNDSSAKKDTSSEYAEAIRDMEEALIDAANEEIIFESSPKVRIYDVHFNLVKEAIVMEETISKDQEILDLLRNSTVLMKSGDVTYYMVEK